MTALKVAILDDYLGLAAKVPDWDRLAGRVEVTSFDRSLAKAPDAAEILAPFDAICLIRERMPIGEALLARLPKLRLICITGPYCRPLDAEAAIRRGLVVTYTELRGHYRRATCELTWGLMLALARNIPGEHESMRRGGWQTGAGFTLSGRTLGLLGLGRQGRRMVPIAQAFGMEVIAWSQNLKPEDAAGLGVRYVGREELFSTADVLSVHLVLGDRSRGIVGAREFALMKPTAILVNVARGAIVDEGALLDALRTGRIAGAGLDVYAEEPLPADHPLRSMPNVVLMPHQGHHVQEFYQVAFGDVVENIEAYLAGSPMRLLDPARNESRFAIV